MTVTRLPTRVKPPDTGKPRTRVSKALRRQQIIQMLLAGQSQAEIARQLKMSPGAVSTAVIAILDAWEQQEAAAVEKVRALQLARIDALVNAHWDAAVGVRVNDETGELEQVAPSVKATDAIRQLEALRARIAGTEAAQKVIHSGSIGFKLDAAEIAEAEKAWLASGGDVIDGTASELTG